MRYEDQGCVGGSEVDLRSNLDNTNYAPSDHDNNGLSSARGAGRGS